jgi:hypothetical protein
MPTDRIAKLTSKLVKEMRARQSKLQRELAGIQAGLKAFGEVLTGGAPSALGRRKAAGGSGRRARTCAECGKTGHDRRWHFKNGAAPAARKPAKRKAKKKTVAAAPAAS